MLRNVLLVSLASPWALHSGAYDAAFLQICELLRGLGGLTDGLLRKLVRLFVYFFFFSHHWVAPNCFGRAYCRLQLLLRRQHRTCLEVDLIAALVVCT